MPKEREIEENAVAEAAEVAEEHKYVKKVSKRLYFTRREYADGVTCELWEPFGDDEKMREMGGIGFDLTIEDAMELARTLLKMEGRTLPPIDPRTLEEDIAKGIAALGETGGIEELKAAFAGDLGVYLEGFGEEENNWCAKLLEHIEKRRGS
jgi:hypothetical protein